MSEFLERFHAAMEGYVWGSPDDPQPLLDAFPEWKPNTERLAIYGEFIQYYQGECLSALYGRTQELLGEAAWGELLRAYYAIRPAHGYQINTLGHDLPAFMAEQGALAPHLAQVALFELTKHLVYTSEETHPAEVEAPSVNPTLQTLQLTHQVCGWAKAAAQRPEPVGEPPPEGEELALLWRNPTSLRANYVAAGPRSLLALKIALEGISVEEAAAAGGVEPADVLDALHEQAGFGLISLPKSFPREG